MKIFLPNLDFILLLKTNICLPNIFAPSFWYYDSKKLKDSLPFPSPSPSLETQVKVKGPVITKPFTDAFRLI